jgi:hypothetical protein
LQLAARVRLLDSASGDSQLTYAYAVGQGGARVATRLARLRWDSARAVAQSRRSALRRWFDLWRGRCLLTSAKREEMRVTRPKALALERWLDLCRRRKRARVYRALAQDAHCCFVVRRAFFGWLKLFAGGEGHVAQRLRVEQLREAERDELGRKAFVCFLARRAFYSWRNGFLRRRQLT